MRIKLLKVQLYHTLDRVSHVVWQPPSESLTTRNQVQRRGCPPPAPASAAGATYKLAYLAPYRESWVETFSMFRLAIEHVNRDPSVLQDHLLSFEHCSIPAATKRRRSRVQRASPPIRRQSASVGQSTLPQS
jgi:hypothetical protein